MELLDVVNEIDQVVGTASNEECHAKGLGHRAVHVEIWNSARTHVLTHRRKSKLFTGRRDICGGHVTAGEQPYATALRELREEYGLAHVRLEFATSFPDAWDLLDPQYINREIVYVYRGMWDGDPALLSEARLDGYDFRMQSIDELRADYFRNPTNQAMALKRMLLRYNPPMWDTSKGDR